MARGVEVKLVGEVQGDGAHVVVHEPVQADADREHEQALRRLDHGDEPDSEF
jgi:hypothetical protein